MKILYLIPSWGQPSELWALRMLEMLQGRVAIICTRDKDLNIKWNGIPVIGLQKSPSITEKLKHKFRIPDSTYYEEERLSKIIANFEIDCLFIHFLSIAIWFKNLINKKKLPTYIHCHGADITWDIALHDKPGEKIYNRNYIDSVLNFYKNVKFIANSKYSSNKLKEIGVNEKDIYIKHLGVPVEDIFPTKKQDDLSNKNILFLGRLVDCKGPDLVIKAFELACSKGLKANLIIAGDGPLKLTCELLRARSHYKELIQLLGSVDASTGENLRAAAHIFTAHNCKGPLSNQEEAYGVSIVEAMAAGIPVISARSGALSETVLHEETGILIEPGDIEGHSEAFLRLASDEKLSSIMGKAGWQRVKNYFSYESEKEKLLEILVGSYTG